MRRPNSLPEDHRTSQLLIKQAKLQSEFKRVHAVYLRVAAIDDADAGSEPGKFTEALPSTGTARAAMVVWGSRGTLLIQ